MSHRREVSDMSFKLAEYKEPDFTKKMFTDAPNASLVRAPHAKAAPKGFHATSIFPEYFKTENGIWLRTAEWTPCRYGTEKR
jgi:hypothetical protein